VPPCQWTLRVMELWSATLGLIYPLQLHVMLEQFKIRT